MKIAVVGGGYAGLAVTWNFLKYPQVSVDLFDPNPIGGSASKVSAGLLHPFAGLHSKKIIEADEGIKETRELLNIAASELSLPVSIESGLLRPALTKQQVDDYTLCAKRFPETRWLSTDECLSLYPSLSPNPGLWIPEALTVNTHLYLEGLWNASRRKGANWEQRSVHSLEELKDYDAIILCTGAQATPFLEVHNIKLSPLKGQIIELEWPSELPLMPFPINSQVYLIMNPDNKSCSIGATFERKFSDHLPDIAVAKQELLPKALELIPALSDAKILRCRAALRACTPDHRPLIKRLTDTCWIFTGLGSKGLIYHALYAKKIVDQVVRNGESYHG